MQKSREKEIPFDKLIANRLRIARKMRGMSQSELGEAVGVTFQQVQKMESSHNRIGAGRLKLIADALELPVIYFFTDTDTGETPVVSDELDLRLKLARVLAHTDDRLIDAMIVLMRVVQDLTKGKTDK